MAGGQELFFGSVLNLTWEIGQAFAPIVYNDFRLPVDVSSPPTNPVGTPEETLSEDTGGKNTFIQGLHGDYIVIF